MGGVGIAKMGHLVIYMFELESMKGKCYVGSDLVNLVPLGQGRIHQCRGLGAR